MQEGPRLLCPLFFEPTIVVHQMRYDFADTPGQYMGVFLVGNRNTQLPHQIKESKITIRLETIDPGEICLKAFALPEFRMQPGQGRDDALRLFDRTLRGQVAKVAVFIREVFHQNRVVLGVPFGMEDLG